MILRKQILFILFFLCFSGKILSASTTSDADSLIFVNYSNVMKKNTDLSLNELIVKTGIYFLGSPYLAGSLEQKGEEQLVINLREFDCTTFVENCIALSITMKSPNKSFSYYKSVLQKLRYRDGMITDYSSRLHYSSDWIFENAKKGIWRNQTQNLGGYIQNKLINYMSSHPQSYPALKNDHTMCQKIAEQEKAITDRQAYILLPKEKIATADKSLQNGDIVFFGTNIDGLDFSHMAIIIRNKEVATFIHASSTAKKVIIEAISLADYCMKSKNCNGIAIVRLNEITK